MFMPPTNCNQRDLWGLFLAKKITGYFVAQDAKEALTKIGCLETLKKITVIKKSILCLNIL